MRKVYLGRIITFLLVLAMVTVALPIPEMSMVVRADSPGQEKPLTGTGTEPEPGYLTFRGTSDFSIAFNNGKSWEGTLEYSTDLDYWQKFEGYAESSDKVL